MDETQSEPKQPEPKQVEQRLKKGERVFSIRACHYPGCAGVITSIDPCEDRLLAPDGYMIHATVKVLGAQGYCIFEPSDLVSLETPLSHHEKRILEFLRQKERLSSIT